MQKPTRAVAFSVKQKAGKDVCSCRLRRQYIGSREIRLTTEIFPEDSDIVHIKIHGKRVSVIGKTNNMFDQISALVLKKDEMLRMSRALDKKQIRGLITLHTGLIWRLVARQRCFLYNFVLSRMPCWCLQVDIMDANRL